MKIGDLVYWINRDYEMIEDIGVVVDTSSLDVYILWQRVPELSGWHEKNHSYLELVENAEQQN